VNSPVLPEKLPPSIEKEAAFFFGGGSLSLRKKRLWGL